jgi:hypothetical protein
MPKQLILLEYRTGFEPVRKSNSELLVILPKPEFGLAIDSDREDNQALENSHP